MNIHVSALLRHYKRPDIQQALVSAAENKEVAVRFGDKGFGKRPDVLLYPKDVLTFAQRGATSFHCSEEHWLNPLQLQTGVDKKTLNELRLGWDLILDIDCPILDYSKIAADLLIQALHHYDIEHVAVKFSGNHGFHIAVPRLCFPERIHDIDIKNLFPEGPRRVASFLGDKIKPFLAKKLLEYEPIHVIAERMKKNIPEIIEQEKLNPYSLLSIDTVLISSRHLYRMPYSFNEKSGLVSIPIHHREILLFDKKQAQWDRINNITPFLWNLQPKTQEAAKLITESYDYTAKLIQEIPKEKKYTENEEITTAIIQDCFPPCMQLLQKGMQDGKKRSLFILTNFLSSIGWNKEQIRQYVEEWNKKNHEPLREVILQGHLRYHGEKKQMPPNCSNAAYYPSLGICKPDGLCKKIKNPVNYAIIKHKKSQENTPIPEVEFN